MYLYNMFQPSTGSSSRTNEIKGKRAKRQKTKCQKNAKKKVTKR